jgi:pimeloyl-ACP methyl ester carboxylesterase
MTASSAVTGDAVATNGIQLAYQVTGTGDPLLLIMGLGADRSAWQPHVQCWEHNFRCLAVDNRGAGRSSAPDGPYTTAMMADDYAGLLQALGLGAVRVVGISMGGAVAQELALRHPQLVQRLVLVSTWAQCDAYTSEVFETLAALQAIVSPREFAQLLQLWIWSPGYFAAHRDELRAERPEAAGMTPAAFTAQAAACRFHDTTLRLPGITVPTLITAGTADIFTPVLYAQQLQAGLPHAELRLFPGTGHAHHWEALDQFNTDVAQWLS